ncbi:MAG: ricin-type beta-trefoil lectin domain protein, partial [Porphyrobacter sp.]|nr:ricin-type beta-trefoil lectin domain protein [Porphyrobacter sp.]
AIPALLAGMGQTASAQSISGMPVIASYHAQGRCLDMRASDGQLLLWRCHGGSNQIFRFVSGNYGMISLGDQRCLTIGARSGMPATVQPCTNASAQRFGFQANGTLRNENGLCLDIEGGARGDGARILSFDCHGGSNQQWYPGIYARSAALSLPEAAQLRGRSDARAFLRSGSFSGGNIVASGGGNIVSGGAGNLIANDGAGIVAGGAGNMLARFGGGIVASGGGNIVAGGAGNLLPGNWSFFSGAGAGIIAGGAGN